MADRTIVNLPEATSVSNTDLLLVVSTSDNNPTNRKITVENLRVDLGSLPVYTNNTVVNALTSMSTGDIVYLTSTSQVAIYDGSDWKVLGTLGSTLS